MSTDTETQLRRMFQNPLQSFQQWKPSVQMLLETPEPELAHIEVAKLLVTKFRNVGLTKPADSWKVLPVWQENPQ